MPDVTPEMLYGGAGLALAYRIGIVSGAYQIQKPDGSGPATSLSDYALKLEGYVEQTQCVPQSDGSMKVTFDNYDVSSAIIGFLNRFAKKLGAGGKLPPAVAMEHGVSRGGSSAATQPLMLWQVYGALNAAETDRLCHWGIGMADLSSGPIIQKDGQWIKPIITVNGQIAEYALSIPADLWDDRFVDLAAAVTVPQYSPYEREYLAAA